MKRTHAHRILTVALGLLVLALLALTPVSGSKRLTSDAQAAVELLYFAEISGNKLIITEFDARTNETEISLTQTFSGAADVIPVLSPDTDRIAILTVPEEEAAMWHSEIWAGSVRGPSLQPMVSGVMPSKPVWSRDGNELAYTKLVSKEGTSNRIEIRELDVQSHQDRLLTIREEAVEIHPLLWSLDGETLYYQAFRNGGDAFVWALDAVKGTSEVVIEGTLGRLPYGFELAPDGKRLGFAWLDREQETYDYEVRILDLDTGAVQSAAHTSYLELGDLHWSPESNSLLFNGVNQEIGLHRVLRVTDVDRKLGEISELSGAFLVDVFPDGSLLVVEDTETSQDVYLVGHARKRHIAADRLYLGSRLSENLSNPISPFIQFELREFQLPPDAQPIRAKRFEVETPAAIATNGDDIVSAAQAEVNKQSHYLIAGHGGTGTSNPTTSVVNGKTYYCHTYPNRGQCTTHRHFDCVGLVATMYEEQRVLNKLADTVPWTVNYILSWWERNHPDRVHRDYDWSERSPGDPVIVKYGNHIGIYAAGDRLINASGGYCSNPLGCSGQGVVNNSLSAWRDGFVAYIDIDWGDSPTPPQPPQTPSTLSLRWWSQLVQTLEVRLWRRG